MEYEVLSRTAESHGDSFYLFYPECFSRNLNDINAAFKSLYPATILAYALKANYMPALVRIIDREGHWGEVVSDIEYDIARRHLPAKRLIFNGPCKTRDDVAKALTEGAVLNLDSFSELQLLISLLDEHRDIGVGLRVNFDIGTGVSRFGFNFENGDFNRAVDAVLETGKVRISGLHSHFTTRERSLALFERRMEGMLRVYESIAPQGPLDYFNVGGGFWGPLSDTVKRRLGVEPPIFLEYAQVIAGRMRDHFGEGGPHLVIEPGVSLVADTMDYVVRILDYRKSGAQHILTVDGSINNLYATGSRFSQSYSVVSSSGGGGARTYDVAGNTCMEHDVLMSDAEMNAKPGDFIVFHNRGAYSNVYTPPFIRPAPPIVGVDGVVYARRQEYQDILSHYAG